MEWRCEKCGNYITTKREEFPDPDETFWKGHRHGSEVETCEEMMVDGVHDL